MVICEILKCEGDVWWTGGEELNQLTEKAIPAFVASFPRCQALFAFDNAKIHQKYSSNALPVSNLNLMPVPGGKNTVPMRNGFYIHPDTPNSTQVQCMMLCDG